MTARTFVVRPIDVVVNSAGPWSTVRVDQPYGAMRNSWDVRFVATPFDALRDIRDGALVIGSGRCQILFISGALLWRGGVDVDVWC